MTPSELNAINIIMQALAHAKHKWPQWLYDPVHASAVVAEESGELTQAALDFCYSDGDIMRMVEEAAQVGAMAIRFLEGVDRYERVQRYCK